MDPSFELVRGSWTHGVQLYGGMLKYSDQFKLQVVERYSSSSLGFLLVGREFGLAAATVRRWVRLYKAHAEQGLTHKVGQYSAEFKLRVLTHMWENSLSHIQVAALFNVRNPSSISHWCLRYEDAGIEGLMRSPPQKMKPTTPPEKPQPPADDQRTREELLAENEELRMEVAILKKLEALAQARKDAPTKSTKKRW
jgi:transposase